MHTPGLRCVDMRRDLEALPGLRSHAKRTTACRPATIASRLQRLARIRLRVTDVGGEVWGMKRLDPSANPRTRQEGGLWGHGRSSGRCGGS